MLCQLAQFLLFFLTAKIAHSQILTDDLGSDSDLRYNEKYSNMVPIPKSYIDMVQEGSKMKIKFKRSVSDTMPLDIKSLYTRVVAFSSDTAIAPNSSEPIIVTPVSKQLLSSFRDKHYSFILQCFNEQSSYTVSEIFNAVSSHSEGCPMVASNLMQNIYYSSINGTDDRYPRYIGTDRSIDDICQHEHPIWSSVDTRITGDGRGDAEVLVPFTPDGNQTVTFTRELSICNQTMYRVSLKLTGMCKISKKTLSVYKFCSLHDKPIGVFIRDRTKHTTYQPGFGLFSILNMFKTNGTSFYGHPSKFSSIQRYSLDPSACLDLNIMADKQNWLLDSYMKCGSVEYEARHKFTLESKCRDKYQSFLSYHFCSNYFFYKVLLAILSVALCWKLISYFKLQSLLLPFSLLSKPIEYIAGWWCIKCRYCKMPIFNLWHKCHNQCMCGYRTSLDTVPSHDCPLDEPQEPNDIEDLGENLKLRQQLMPKVITPSMTSLNKSMSIKSNLNNKVKKANRYIISLNNPLNRILTKLVFSLFVGLMTASLLPYSLADYQYNCLSTGIQFDYNSETFIFMPRSPKYNHTFCGDNEMKIYISGSCLFRKDFYHRAFNYYTDKGENENDPHPIYAANLGGYSQLFLTRINVERLKAFVMQSGPSVNDLSLRDYCKTLSIYISKTHDLDGVANAQFKYPEKVDNTSIVIDSELIGESSDDLVYVDPTVVEILFSRFSSLGNSGNDREAYMLGDSTSVLGSRHRLHYFDLDHFQKSLFDSFSINEVQPKLGTYIPMHINALQNEDRILNVKLNSLTGEAASFNIADSSKGILPLNIMFYIKSTSVIYPGIYQYTTARLDKTNVTTNVNCYKGCTDCKSELKSSIGEEYNEKHAVCWESANTLMCHDQKCSAYGIIPGLGITNLFDKGSLCTYCRYNASTEVTDVYRLGPAQPRVILCISVNGKTGCKTLTNRITETKAWGQVQNNVRFDHLPVNSEKLLAYEHKTSKVFTGDIATYREDCNKFGLPQYKNNKIIHEIPEIDASYDCKTIHGFDIVIRSCTRETYKQLESLDETALEFDGSNFKISNVDLGDIEVNLKIPDGIYEWVERDSKIDFKVYSIKGCMNCEQVGEIDYRLYSDNAGYATMSCDNFTLISNVVTVSTNATKVSKSFGYLHTTNDNTVSCNIVTKGGSKVGTSSYTVRKQDIISGYVPDMSHNDIKEITEHHINPDLFDGFGLGFSLPFYDTLLNLWKYIKIVIMVVALAFGLYLVLLVFGYAKFAYKLLPSVKLD